MTAVRAGIRLLAAANRGTALLAGIALLLMMLAGAADVIMTNLDLLGLQSRPVPSTTEFMATMMVVVVFLGLALAQQRRAHIRITLSRLAGPRLERPLDVFRHALHGLFYGLIAWFGWSVAAHSAATGEFAAGLVNFPVWPARLILAIGATGMALQCLADIAGVFDARFHASDAGDAVPWPES
jgi:TRAP-type C4-dicarboxylate transport system permease small subunit